MRLIGLTGGIASGKSTVSQILAELGAPIIDADALAREAVRPGQPALREIELRFPGVVGEKGQLDRKALGQRIFANEEERQALNAILHPRIHQLFHQAVERLEHAGAPLAVYDAPLLIENGLHHLTQGVVLVYLPPEVQLKRLMERDGLSPQEAQLRLRAQLPLDQKRVLATWIIDNSGSREATRSQVEQLWASLRASP